MASGFLRVQQPNSLASIVLVTPQQRSHVVTLQSTAPSYIPLIKAAGIDITTNGLTDHLIVNPIPQSELISISFKSDSAAEAATVVNTILNAYLAQSSSVQLATLAARPTVPQRNILYPLTGAAAGAVLGLA